MHKKEVLEMTNEQLREASLDLLGLPAFHELRKPYQPGFLRRLEDRIFPPRYEPRDADIAIQLREVVEPKLRRGNFGEEQLKRLVRGVFGGVAMMASGMTHPRDWMKMSLFICKVDPEEWRS